MDPSFKNKPNKEQKRRKEGGEEGRDRSMQTAVPPATSGGSCKEVVDIYTYRVVG